MDPATTQVGPDFISAHLEDAAIRLVEVDVSPAQYATGHIPGAVLWDAYVDLRHPDYGVVPHRELEALVRRSGIGPDTTVVTYGYAAHLGYWLLRSCGHDRVKLMDGTRDRWVKAGHEWATDVPAPAASDYVLPAQDRFIASHAEVSGMAVDSARSLVDVRAEAEYSGAQFWPSGAPESVGRPGHIPGAIHVPIDSLRTSEGTFRSAEEMRRVLDDHGITPGSAVVTYCTIGNRAAQAWYAMSILLGYGHVAVFYDSYVSWGMDTASRIEP